MMKVRYLTIDVISSYNKIIKLYSFNILGPPWQLHICVWSTHFLMGLRGLFKVIRRPPGASIRKNWDWRKYLWSWPVLNNQTCRKWTLWILNQEQSPEWRRWCLWTNMPAIKAAKLQELKRRSWPHYFKRALIYRVRVLRLAQRAW